MKKYLFLFAVCVSLALSSGQAYAQRYLPGMKGVELRGGFAGNLKSPVTGTRVLPFRDIRKGQPLGGWSGIPAEELRLSRDFRSTSPVYCRRRLLFEVPVRPGEDILPFCRRFCPVGYETLNWGEKVLYDGSMLSTGMPSSMAEP